MSLEYLGLSSDATEADVTARYKELAKQKHPDRGGSAEEFQQLQVAYEAAKQEVSYGQSLSRARIQLDTLRNAARGARCPRCDGTGTSRTVQQGFRSFKMACRLCKGRGHL